MLKAKVLLIQGKPKDSLSLLDQEIPPSLATSPTAIERKLTQVFALSYVRDFDKARQRLVEAAQLVHDFHPELSGDLSFADGTRSLRMHEESKAQKTFLEALRLARQNRNHFLEAASLLNLGFISMRQGQLDTAIDWFTQSLTASQRLQNRTLIEKITGNLAICYHQVGDYNRAIENLRISEAASIQLGLLKDQLGWNSTLGLIYRDLRDYQASEDHLQRAVDIGRKLDEKDSLVLSLDNLALVLIDQGKLAKADQYATEALRLNSDLKDSMREKYGMINKARILAGRGQYDEAEKIFRKVIQDPEILTSLRWEAQSYLAHTIAARGQTVRADAAYRTTLSTMDTARASLSHTEYRMSFISYVSSFYDEYIEFLVSQGRQREALAVAEHSRARTLAEGLGVDVSKQAAFRPEQTARDHHAVLLEYWLKPGSSYLWAVTPSKVSVFKLPSIDDINSAVQSYRKALLDPRLNGEKSAKAGEDLYAMLVSPAQKLIPAGSQVVIVADNSLHSLNFETLIASKIASNPHPHFWIEDVTLVSSPSIALLATHPKVAPTKNKNLLLVGDPISANADFPPLTQAKKELGDVESHFAADTRKVLQGSQATPSAYMGSDAGRFSYIHFATHGTASLTTPLESSIVLSPEADNYKLYARDIMKQPLSARLVTISACYGAGTRAYSGEGLVGLSWAFLRAGSHNVIASLWEVNDLSTPQLMNDLYTGLDKGQEPATALRNAKLIMLHSQGVYRKPFYWGAFQLYTR